MNICIILTIALIILSHSNTMKRFISLKDYGKTGNDVQNIRNKIRENLGKSIFDIKDFQSLQFEALRQISDVRRSVKNDYDSIFKASGKVMAYFEFRRATLKKLNAHNKFEEVKTKKEETQLDLFNMWILGFDTAPYDELNYLEKNTKFHLKYITDLISKYEDEKYIQSYLETGKTYGSSGDKKILDFYKRCLKERNEIIGYMVNGMEDRAISRANTKLGLSMGINYPYYDFPYKSWSPYMNEFFDYQKINKVAHRCFEMPASLEKFYNNKPLFYKKYFKIKPASQIFINIDFFYNHIPQTNDRKPIFDELTRLFKAKRWLAFYALAIPQVEGLFTEMLKTIIPGYKGKSLPEKVEKLRPSYALSDAYFDYYQYIIPELRNKFAHIGFEEDLKLKSYDLLTDLEYILQVYYELDDPFVKVKRIIKQKRTDDFISYGEISQFFELITLLHHNQRFSIEEELNSFFKDFTIKNCQFEYIIEEASKIIRKITPELLHLIEKATNSSDIAIAFEDKNPKNIKTTLQRNKKEFLSLYNIYDYKFDELYELKNFKNGLKKHYEDWDSEEKNEFLNTIQEFQSKINNLLEIREFNISENSQG